MKIATFLVLLLFCIACNQEESSNEKTGNSKEKITTSSDSKPQNSTKTPTMTKIEQILIGDWIEDSIAFKLTYNSPPPPVQNTRVRYQEDGYVYIPGVLLSKEHWDKWEVANDTTLHIIKRQGYGVREFIIDSISQDVIKYRFKTPSLERKVRLMRIK